MNILFPSPVACNSPRNLDTCITYRGISNADLIAAGICRNLRIMTDGNVITASGNIITGEVTDSSVLITSSLGE